MRIYSNLANVMATAVTSQTLPKVLVIAGNTAVGKTDLSLELCKTLNGEIVSADSVQIYHHVDVGSAKVGVAERDAVPHHLIDIVDVTEPYNAADHHDNTIKAIEEILSRDRLPVVVGGTNFYIDFLLKGKTGAPPSTAESRKVIDELLEEDGGDWDKSVARLEAIDPVYAASISRNNWFRLKRGLDICLQSGRTVTSYKPDESVKRPFDFRCLFLTLPRVKLFRRIDYRPLSLIKETINLVREHGLCLESQVGRSIGYRQALQYLSDIWGFTVESGDRLYDIKVPKANMQQSFLTFLTAYQGKTRQLASDQMKRWRDNESFTWINMCPGGDMLPLPLVAERVREWFMNDTPLPDEWDGRPLTRLTKELNKQLFMYQTANSIYSIPGNVEKILTEIEEHLKSLQLKSESPFDIRCLFLTLPRVKLFRRIDYNRQLASDQMKRWRDNESFTWINMCPGGDMLPLPLVAERVREWFMNDTPLPDEWDGRPLTRLTKELNKQLFMYQTANSIYNIPGNIEKILTEIEEHLKSLQLKSESK